MIFEQVAVGPLQCNCYILGCEETREALVIDPGDEAQLILPLLAKHALTVKYILSTHAHIDHVGDLERLKEQTGAQALLHEKDLQLYQNLPMQASWLGLPLPPTTRIDHFIHQGDRVSFGKTLRRGTIHPGPHPRQPLPAPAATSRSAICRGYPFSNEYRKNRSLGWILQRHHRIHTEPTAAAGRKHGGLSRPWSTHDHW